MRHMICGLAAVLCVVAAGGCTAENEGAIDPLKGTATTPQSDVPPASGRAAASNPFQIIGTVTHKDMEGGFYAIEGVDGKKYDPVNLPESFRKDGLKVKITARRKVGLASFHMYGEVIEVLSVEAQ